MGHLRGKHGRDRHRWTYRLSQHRPVTPLVQPVALIAVEHIDCRQRPRRVCGHRSQHPLEPSDQPVDLSFVEHIGVVFDTQPQFGVRQSLNRQWVVVVLPVGEVRDGQSIRAGEFGGIDRIVLVDEESVEEMILARDPVDLAEGQMLVIKGLGIGVLQLVQQFGGGGRRRSVRPHRHRIDQQADHRVGTVDLVWASETVVPNAMSSWPVSDISSWA